MADELYNSAPLAPPQAAPLAAAQGPSFVDLMSAALLHQESGNSDKVGTSVTGAVGPGQIEPGTFAQYAQPGEVITDPAANRAVHRRIVEDYVHRYGEDPARIAVAYFSGPGNVAPAGSPTPYLHDHADPNGKSTSSYANDILGRVASLSGKSLPANPSYASAGGGGNSSGWNDVYAALAAKPSAGGSVASNFAAGASGAPPPQQQQAPPAPLAAPPPVAAPAAIPSQQDAYLDLLKRSKGAA